MYGCFITTMTFNYNTQQTIIMTSGLTAGYTVLMCILCAESLTDGHWKCMVQYLMVLCISHCQSGHTSHLNKSLTLWEYSLLWTSYLLSYRAVVHSDIWTNSGP